MQKASRRSGIRINAELPKPMYAALKAEAIRRHVSVSAVVRWSIEDHLQGQTSPPTEIAERAS